MSGYHGAGVDHDTENGSPLTHGMAALAAFADGKRNGAAVSAQSAGSKHHDSTYVSPRAQCIWGEIV